MRAASLAATIVVGLSLLGCGEPAASARPGLAGLADVFAGAPDPDLLARARASMHGGALDPAMRAALAASPYPRDRRAARLLAAFDAPEDPQAPDEDDDSPATELADAPRIKMGTQPPAEAPAPPTRPRASAAPAASAPASAPVRARAKLERVGLSSTTRGAALSLRGSGGLVVGVASQPASGIVRLVMDAEASTGALRSRPRVRGARVTGIRRTGKTVFVTLTLDPGWSLRGITRTRSGARVELDEPA